MEQRVLGEKAALQLSQFYSAKGIGKKTKAESQKRRFQTDLQVEVIQKLLNNNKFCLSFPRNSFLGRGKYRKMELYHTDSIKIPLPASEN